MTALVREALRPAFKAAKDAHPGLLLQRGWADFVQTNSENAGANGTPGKSAHIARICAIPASELYERAYQRWASTTSNSQRFSQLIFKIDGRLLIGLAGSGSLETGCAISHSHGMPYLPGSSIKGVVRAWAEIHMPDWQSQFDELFGREDRSGLVAFHDGWWIPHSGSASHKNRPFAADIVTPHHPEYYAGKKAATDLDSPVPNSLIGVRGSLMLVLEGEENWRRLAAQMLTKALAQQGIGAKTRAGYGYLQLDEKETCTLTQKASQQASEQQFIPATLKYNPGTRELTATLQDGEKRSTAPVKGAQAEQLLAKLDEAARTGKKIKEGKLKVEVQIRHAGENCIELKDLRPLQEIMSG